MNQPLVSFVVIGLNEAANLDASIASLSTQGFAREQIEIVYVDSGSTDASVAVAQYAGVDRVLSIARSSANAARARNLGLENVAAPFVHFVDGDTRLEPGWTRIGIDALESNPILVGVEGDLREASPAQNLYDAVCELDWPARPGPVDYVSGNSLYRVQSLLEVGGFDPVMYVGEEPELGVRLRANGGQLLHLDAIMAWHHLDIRSLREYLRRNYTSGASCAMVASRTGGLARGYWSGRLWRTLAHAALLVSPLLVAVPMLAAGPGPAAAVACLSPAWLMLLALRKSRSAEYRSFQLSSNRADSERRYLALAAGFHTYLSKLPAALGVVSVIVSGRAKRRHDIQG